MSTETIALPCGARYCGTVTATRAACGAFRCDAHLAEHELACRDGGAR